MHKTAVPNGIFLGVAMMVCSYVIYLVNANEFYTTRPSLLLAILFLLYLKTGREARKAQNGFLTWGQGFKNMFVTGVVALAMCTFFEYLMVNYLTPDLLDIQKDFYTTAQEQTLTVLSDLFEEEQVEVLEEKYENMNYGGAGFYLQQFFTRLFIPVAFMASLIALFIMKKPPEGMTGGEDKEEKRYVINK